MQAHMKTLTEIPQKLEKHSFTWFQQNYGKEYKLHLSGLKFDKAVRRV